MTETATQKPTESVHEPATGPPSILEGSDLTLGRNLDGDRLDAFWQIGSMNEEGLTAGDLSGITFDRAGTVVIELLDMRLIAWSGRTAPNQWRVYVLTEEGRTIRRRLREQVPHLIQHACRYGS